MAFKLEIFNLNEQTGTASFHASATSVQYLHPLWVFSYRIQDDSDVQGELLAAKHNLIKMKGTQKDTVNGSDFSIATIHCDFRRVTGQKPRKGEAD